MIVVLAKLCGGDTPTGIAEWAKHRQAELVKLLCLSRARMPSHHTIRRVMAHVVYQEEIERLVGEYKQRGAHGQVYALDGKAVRGMRKKEEEGNEYLLSVYDVEQAKVMAQVEVGRKENEISKASKALKLVEIAQKVVTGDAMHIQRGFAAQIVEKQGDYILPVKENQPQLYKNIQSLFAPEYPKPGFGKIQTDFLIAQKVNKGHGRIETRIMTTSEMLNTYIAWPGLAQVYRLERQFQWRRNGHCYRTSHEMEFGITSLTRKQASPLQILDLLQKCSRRSPRRQGCHLEQRFFPTHARCQLNIRRAHWGIETGLHYRRDATRMTVGATGKIMASINNLALALIRQANFHNAAQARRWFATHLSETFTLLTTPFLVLEKAMRVRLREFEGLSS